MTVTPGEAPGIPAPRDASGGPRRARQTMPLVVRVEDLVTGAKAQFAFIRSPVRIGRSEINDLPLPQGFVSQWHAVVQFDEEGTRYVDLGSTNGSAVDGAPVDRNVPVELGPTTEVRIGSLRLVFERRATGEHRAPTPKTLFAIRAATTGRAAAVEHAPGAGEAPPPPGAPPQSTPAPPSAPAVRAPPGEVAPVLDLSGFTSVALQPAPAAPDPGPPAPAARAPATAPAAGPAGGRPSELEQLLTAFAESYLPASASVRGPDDAQAFLARLAEALEAFSRSFIEMRKGYEEFGRQMGVKTVHGEDAVQRARDPRQLIAVLLDPAQQGRAAELQGAFADYMVHQVALLNGVVEGAKAMLRQVSPDEIEAQAPRSRWPLRAQALWKGFEERFHALADEEDAISDALFGREFGKAYAAMIGQRVRAEREDGGSDREEPR